MNSKGDYPKGTMVYLEDKGTKNAHEIIRLNKSSLLVAQMRDFSIVKYEDCKVATTELQIENDTICYTIHNVPDMEFEDNRKLKSD